MKYLKPTDIKTIASRFVDSHYPQFVSRVDRIWHMLEEMDLNLAFPEQEKEGFQHGNALGIAGAIDPDLKECLRVVSILAYANQTIRNKDAISESDIKIQLVSAPDGLRISAGQLQKLEQIISEIFESNIGEPFEVSNSKPSVEETKRTKIFKDNVVYLSRKNSFGVNRFLVTEEDVHSKYLSDKFQYDIIIYHDTVELKIGENHSGQPVFRPMNLHSNIYKLLVLFLKYKDNKIPFAELYHCAWKEGLQYNKKLEDIELLMAKVKPGVSTLRNTIKPLLATFNIPYAKRENGSYICQGSFQFCMVLKESIDRQCSLAVI